MITSENDGIRVQKAIVVIFDLFSNVSNLLYGVIIAVGSAAVVVERGLLERLVLEVTLAVVLQDLRVV